MKTYTQFMEAVGKVTKAKKDKDTVQKRHSTMGKKNQKKNKNEFKREVGKKGLKNKAKAVGRFVKKSAKNATTTAFRKGKAEVKGRAKMAVGKLSR